MHTLSNDCRLAVRALRRAPAFTLAALATLAVGIGATTAILTVVNAVLLQPPPYPEPERIVTLGYQDGQTYHYVRDRARGFVRIAARGGGNGWNLVVGERAEYVRGASVTDGFFEVLGVNPLFGRTFSPSEAEPNGPRAVILSEPLWRRALGARPEVIGDVIMLGGIPHTIIGVMPAGFRSVPEVDLWTPLRVQNTDTSVNYSVFGRVAPDVSLDQIANDLSRLKQGIPRDLRDISEARSQRLQWMSYQQWLGQASRDMLLLLLGAVVLLLVIACVNVAGLQLVRAIARRREMATRAALGGASARLVQEVLTESVLLALTGAALGVVVARVALHTLLAMVPAGLIETQSVAVDWRVLAATLCVAVTAGIFFGLAPGLIARRVDIRAALWDGARNTAGRPTMWLRRSLAVAQMAIAVILLVAAGLFIRTVVNMQSQELGFDPSNVVVGKMSLQGATQSSAELSSLFDRGLSRLREIPGVSLAAVGNNVPVERGLNLALAPPDGSLVSQPRAVDWRYVTPDYFSVFSIPVRAGRAFDTRDHAHSAAVVIVNEAFARTYFGTTQVVGRVVQLMRGLDDPPREIVGVVADVKGRSASGWTRGLNALAAPVAPAMFVPALQVSDSVLQLAHRTFPINWAVRTSRPGEASTAMLDVIRSIEPRLPFMRFETMQQVISHDLEMQRFLMTLLAVFAAVALGLAAIGIYGLLAYAATQRTQEIGVRIALGASRSSVLTVFLKEGLVLAACSLLIGLGGAAAAGRFVRAFVFGVDPIDPATFVLVAATLLLSTGLATLLPAYRASRVDPLRALRAE